MHWSLVRTEIPLPDTYVLRDALSATESNANAYVQQVEENLCDKVWVFEAKVDISNINRYQVIALNELILDNYFILDLINQFFLST